MSRNFVVKGTIGYVHQGLNKAGEPYQLIKVSGFTFFLPENLRNGFKQGQEVEIHGEYRGDRYSKKNDTYMPEFDIAAVVELPVESVV